MMRQMSSRLLTEWMAYEKVEPFGQDWLQTGMVAAVIANTARDPEKQPEPYTPQTFMPDYSGEDAESAEPDDSWADKTPEEQLAFIEMLNAAFGGQDLRGISHQ